MKQSTEDVFWSTLCFHWCLQKFVVQVGKIGATDILWVAYQEQKGNVLSAFTLTYCLGKFRPVLTLESIKKMSLSLKFDDF